MKYLSAFLLPGYMLYFGFLSSLKYSMLYREFSALELDTVCIFSSENLFFLGPNTQNVCWDREKKKLAQSQETAVYKAAILHIFSQADLSKFSQLFSMAITKSATVSDGTHTH